MSVVLLSVALEIDKLRDEFLKLVVTPNVSASAFLPCAYSTWQTTLATLSRAEHGAVAKNTPVGEICESSRLRGIKRRTEISTIPTHRRCSFKMDIQQRQRSMIAVVSNHHLPVDRFCECCYHYQSLSLPAHAMRPPSKPEGGGQINEILLQPRRSGTLGQKSTVR